jgi:hypothetical protein
MHLRRVTIELEQVHHVSVSCVVNDEIQLLHRVRLRAQRQALAIPASAFEELISTAPTPPAIS